MPYVQQLSSIVEIFDWWLGVKFLCPGLGFSSSVMLVVLYVVCLPFYFLYHTILPCLCSVVCVLENLLSLLHFNYCLV